MANNEQNNNAQDNKIKATWGTSFKFAGAGLFSLYVAAPIIGNIAIIKGISILAKAVGIVSLAAGVYKNPITNTILNKFNINNKKTCLPVIACALIVASCVLPAMGITPEYISGGVISGATSTLPYVPGVVAYPFYMGLAAVVGMGNCIYSAPGLLSSNHLGVAVVGCTALAKKYDFPFWPTMALGAACYLVPQTSEGWLLPASLIIGAYALPLVAVCKAIKDRCSSSNNTVRTIIAQGGSAAEGDAPAR